MTDLNSTPISKAVLNSLKILAERGDPQAIEALARSQEIDFDLSDEDAKNLETEEIKVVLEWSDGMHIVTDHGASFIPKEAIPDEDEERE
ncbi:hypothetical protein [Sphaerothrix gracilis]|uniref:hypothetical protein n=1 Tax=Sphaerothrix gracilis TaxID=3151835 RepID=UPI0031FC0354